MFILYMISISFLIWLINQNNDRKRAHLLVSDQLNYFNSDYFDSFSYFLYGKSNKIIGLRINIVHWINLKKSYFLNQIKSWRFFYLAPLCLTLILTLIILIHSNSSVFHSSLRKGLEISMVNSNLSRISTAAIFWGILLCPFSLDISHPMSLSLTSCELTLSIFSVLSLLSATLLWTCFRDPS